MGRRVIGSAAQIRVVLIDVRRRCFTRGRPFHVRGGGRRDREQGSPESLSISTFPHSLWMWPGRQGLQATWCKRSRDMRRVSQLHDSNQNSLWKL